MISSNEPRPHASPSVSRAPALAGPRGLRRCAVLVLSLLGLPFTALSSDARPWVAFVENGEPRLIRDEAQSMQTQSGHLVAGGPNNVLFADGYLGEGDFHVQANLLIDRPEGSSASFVVNRNAHFNFGGAAGQITLDGRFFVDRGPSHAVGRQADYIQPGKPFRFEVLRRGKEVRFLIDGRVVHRMEPAVREFGMIGFRPHQGTIRLADFRAQGEFRPLLRRTQGPTYGLPIIDLTAEKQRQVIIARGTPDVYQGHPTTVLMADRRTMFAAWTYDHGGFCGPLKRSDDGGLTWGELIPVPDNWRTIRNCPTIHRLTDPAGKERLLVYAGNGDMHQSVSEDGGRTWTPMAKNGLRAVVAPITIVPIAGNRHLAHYHWRPSDGSARLAIWQSVSADGGLTWEPGHIVATYAGAAPCEPALIRSPDGRQLISVMRENSRRYNSLLIVSNDDGRTWSEPVELPASLTGDRHMPRYTADGRLVITFRDMAPRSPTRGNFVAWIGTYDDIVNLREGQYRVHLVKMHGYDSGYGGVELLPDGTIAATTYCALAPGEKPSVVSVRFTMAELDAKAKSATATQARRGGG